MEIDPAIKNFLDEFLVGDWHLTSLTGGGNNRVFRVESQNGVFLLKQYFQHPDDQRDRLGNEFSFMDFAWKCGVRTIPKPFAANRAANCAIYEFIVGKTFQNTDICAELNEQALDFYVHINQHREDSDAKLLSNASEACFSIAEHLNSAAWRLARLENLEINDDIDREASSLVKGEILPRWEELRERVLNEALTLGFDPGIAIGTDDRRLSPSDFGFHNAVLKNGKAYFIDFEYAGWDDPVKMICDFFLHPGLPVDRSGSLDFARKALSDQQNPDLALKKTHLLFPVHQIKWICIILNEFLPVSGKRRRFADPNANFADKRERQLAKAKQRFDLNEGLGQ